MRRLLITAAAGLALMIIGIVWITHDGPPSSGQPGSLKSTRLEAPPTTSLPYLKRMDDHLACLMRPGAYRVMPHAPEFVQDTPALHLYTVQVSRLLEVGSTERIDQLSEAFGWRATPPGKVATSYNWVRRLGDELNVYILRLNPGYQTIEELWQAPVSTMLNFPARCWVEGDHGKLIMGTPPSSPSTTLPYGTTN